MAGRRKRGPRGGETTISARGFVRKTVLLSPQTNDALRAKAFAERRPEAEIVREALDRALGPAKETSEG